MYKTSSTKIYLRLLCNYTSLQIGYFIKMMCTYEVYMEYSFVGLSWVSLKTTRFHKQLGDWHLSSAPRVYPLIFTPSQDLLGASRLPQYAWPMSNNSAILWSTILPTLHVTWYIAVIGALGKILNWQPFSASKVQHTPLQEEHARGRRPRGMRTKWFYRPAARMCMNTGAVGPPSYPCHLVPITPLVLRFRIWQLLTFRLVIVTHSDNRGVPGASNTETVAAVAVWVACVQRQGGVWSVLACLVGSCLIVASIFLSEIQLQLKQKRRKNTSQIILFWHQTSFSFSECSSMWWNKGANQRRSQAAILAPVKLMERDAVHDDNHNEDGKLSHTQTTPLWAARPEKNFFFFLPWRIFGKICAACLC